MAGKKYRVVYDREACIGAAACAAVAPEFWKMADDGKADLVGHTRDEDGKQVLIIDGDALGEELKKRLELHVEAAEVCPVQAIHVYDEETGEKLV